MALLSKQELRTWRKLFQIASRSVWKHWRPNLAAILAVAAGFTASAVFQGFIDNAAKQFDEGFTQRAMFGHIIIQKAGYQTEHKRDPWAYSLNDAEQNDIREFLNTRAAEIEGSVRFLILQGMISNGKHSTIFFAAGHDIQDGAKMRGDLWRWDANFGHPLYVAKEKNDITVGRGLARLLSCVPKDEKSADFDGGGGFDPVARPFDCKYPIFQMSTTTETNQINAIQVNVVGMTDSGMRELDRQYVVMDIDSAQTLAGTKSISYLTLKLKDRKTEYQFAKDLVQAMTAKGLKIEAHPWPEDKRGEIYRQGMNLLGIFKSFILIIVAVVGSMSVANTVITSIAQRTREIGTLRSLGFLRRHILMLFTFEGCFISILGSVLGIFIATTLSTAVSHSGIRYFPGLFSEPVPLQITIVPYQYFITLTVLCGVATLSSMFVSRQASKLGITEALSHV